MADGKKKQPMSLNQRHNRILVDLSASQSGISKPKLDDRLGTGVNNDVDIPRFSFDSPVESDDRLGTRENNDDDIPRFSFDSPLESVTATKPEKEENESSFSPELFAGIADFDSIASTLASGLQKSTTAPTEDGDASDKSPEMHAYNVDLPGFNMSKTFEVGNKFQSKEFDSPKKSFGDASDANAHLHIPEKRSTLVKIEGRRRLCRIKNGNPVVGVGENYAGTEEQIFDEVSGFHSPVQGNKIHESTGNEIRDILNDLSSKLESLSIQKNRIPKKVDDVEDFQESIRSKFDNVNLNEGSYEYQAAASSSVFSPNSSGEAEFRGSILNEDQKKVTELKYDKYVAPCEKHVQKLNRKHDKHIEISDDESDDAKILESWEEEFVLSGSRHNYRLQGKIAKMLYPHQRDGLKWLWCLHCKKKGGILGDDMGLGKTMQICGFLAGLFNSNLIRRVLIVAPKTLLTHWQNELSTVGLSGKTRGYFSTCTKTRHYELQYILQDKGVLLTTYDIVRNNVKSLCGDFHHSDDEEDEITWDYMILDEGHLIKNPSTQRAKSLLQIPCRQRIIISGTPIQNNLKELWALFNFCCPELLGDKKEFKEKYEFFINRGNEKNASDREKRIGSSVAKDMRDRIQPYFLRRMKSEVFGDDTTLSKKNEVIVWLRLTQCQRQLYEAFLKSEIVLSACDGSPLAAITILKKICDHPLLLTKRAAEDVLEGMDSMVNQADVHVAANLAKHIADVAERFEIVENRDISCKLSFVMSLLADLVPNGHNVLIFSQSRKMLDLIQASLTSNHYKYQRIDGTTKPSERATIVKDFQEGRGAPVFLLTSQVGGLGLTLTNADRVIVVDPAWNPSTDSQSVDRAYRIGQKKDVIVYRLMTCGTVEEKIYKKQVFKGGLFRSATEQKEQVRYFSQQDLKDLFSLPKQGFDISTTHQQLLEEHDHRHHEMDEFLKAHIEFLETLNIAGVSQHSLLFSKAAPVQAIDIDVEEEVQRIRGGSYHWNRSTTSSSIDPNIYGANFAFNPKDVKNIQRSSPSKVSEPTEAEIRERISRLAHLFSNKAAVSKLPDKGEKIQKQIASLNLQLDQMRVSKSTGDDVIVL